MSLFLLKSTHLHLRSVNHRSVIWVEFVSMRALKVTLKTFILYLATCKAKHFILHCFLETQLRSNLVGIGLASCYVVWSAHTTDELAFIPNSVYELSHIAMAVCYLAAFEKSLFWSTPWFWLDETFALPTPMDATPLLAMPSKDQSQTPSGICHPAPDTPRHPPPTDVPSPVPSVVHGDGGSEVPWPFWKISGFLSLGANTGSVQSTFAHQTSSVGRSQHFWTFLWCMLFAFCRCRWNISSGSWSVNVSWYREGPMSFSHIVQLRDNVFFFFH